MNLVVCDSYHFAYAPIPKNACTSLKYWILSLENRPPADVRAVHKSDVVPHITFEQFLASDRYEGFTTFVVLRDPYQRLVSAYLNKFVKQQWERTDEWLAGHWGQVARDIENRGVFSFADFVRYVDPGSGHALRDDRHWTSQDSLLGQFGFDFYIDFDALQSQMTPIFETCEVPHTLRSIPLLNESIGPTPRANGNERGLWNVSNLALSTLKDSVYGDFDNSELLEIVKSKYKQDYRLYFSRCHSDPRYTSPQRRIE